MYRSIVIFQMKQTTIVGNIGRDAVCREGDGGHKFVSFSVAYAERKIAARALSAVLSSNFSDQASFISISVSTACQLDGADSGRFFKILPIFG